MTKKWPMDYTFLYLGVMNRIYIYICANLICDILEQIVRFRFVFWDVLPCKIIVDRRFRGTCCLHHHHRPDDGGSTYLWNVGPQLFYMAVHPRRQIWTSHSLPWELEISHTRKKITCDQSPGPDNELWHYKWLNSTDVLRSWDNQSTCIISREVELNLLVITIW
jgi:hypothetical protein